LKRALKSVLAGGVALALAGCAGNRSGQVNNHASVALVREVWGNAQYSVGGGPMRPLMPKMQLPGEATIQTGADSQVDLQINGRASEVRLMPRSTLTLKTVEHSAEGYSETRLDLGIGTLLGSVKAISKDSEYEVITPRAVAFIRGGGADFEVQSTLKEYGVETVTFTCITGQMICLPKILGPRGRIDIGRDVKTLDTRQSYTPTTFGKLVPNNPVVPASLRTLKSFEENAKWGVF
jgi:hypothetical protein